MKIGLQIPRFNFPGYPQTIPPTLAEIARTAETAGFSSIWVMDHYYQIAPGLGQADDPMLEGYSVLNYLAALTEHVKLGTLVAGVIYREPAYLVKSVTALDVLSGGRAYFGVGAAWYEQEARGMGFPFPAVKERFERLEETLQIAHQMWADDRSPFMGAHYRLARPINSPQPLTRPHPPIMIGGMGEQKTLRFVARYGDACNLFLRAGLDTLRHKLNVLHGHCDDLGRDSDEIEKTTLGTVHLAPGEMDAADVIKSCEDLAALGFSHAIFNMPNVHEITPLEIFGQQIIPAVREL
ncbi:MAG: LLM class F420-dependent oxidoreductase [Anaerolineales bacterium]|jgi:F420-dependent oxidoreductase-like protein